MNPNVLQSLAESPVCERVDYLKQSVYLTMGSMMNALCAPNDDQLALESKVRSERLCASSIKEKFVEVSVH